MKNKKLIISILAGIMVAVMLLGLIVGILPHDAGAVSSSELKDQLNALKAEKDAITSQIRDLEKQQSQNRENMEDIMQQKGVLEQQIALLQDEITNVNKQIAAFSLLIADKQDELEEAEPWKRRASCLIGPSSSKRTASLICWTVLPWSKRSLQPISVVWRI